MRFLFILTLLLGAFSLPHAAAAQDAGQEIATDTKTTDWSVGAGFGLRVQASGAFMSQAALGALRPRTAPSALLLIERRLSNRAHLLFDVGGSYTTYDNNENYKDEHYLSLTYDYSASTWAGLGLRWVFNPGGIVEVSGIIGIEGGWAKDEGDSFDTSFDDDGTEIEIKTDLSSVAYSFGPQIGMALERKLLDNLYLRFESNLVRASWRGTINDATPEDGTTTTSKASSFSVGLAFSPSIQLRLLI